MVPRSLKCNTMALMDSKFMLLLLIKMNHYGYMVVQYVEIFFVCLTVFFDSELAAI
jgi:hypothetical protein